MQNGPFAFLSVGGSSSTVPFLMGIMGVMNFAMDVPYFQTNPYMRHMRIQGVRKWHRPPKDNRPPARWETYGNLLRLKRADALSALGWYDKTEA